MVFHLTSLHAAGGLLSGGVHEFELPAFEFKRELLSFLTLHSHIDTNSTKSGIEQCR
jgi:hypothetical protein